jgi:hypothetical protein
MNVVLALLLGLAAGFAGGWICYSKWGAKVQAAEAALKKV